MRVPNSFSSSFAILLAFLVTPLIAFGQGNYSTSLTFDTSEVHFYQNEEYDIVTLDDCTQLWGEAFENHPQVPFKGIRFMRSRSQYLRNNAG